jgi:hypothetical protein
MTYFIDHFSAQHRKVRRGYLGHLTRIAKLLERLSERDNDIKEYLNSTAIFLSILIV